MISEELLLRERELLKRVPFCRRHLKNLRDHHGFPYIKAGAAVLYHMPSVEKWLLRKQRGETE